MIVINEVLGNISSSEWQMRAAEANVSYVELDQWMAQRSRFVAHSTDGEEYAISLRRDVRLKDGDVIFWSELLRRMVVVRIKLSDVLAIDLGTLSRQPIEEALRTAVELGHALGNQHWAAVVRGTKVYVPLMVDRKVMESVMQTHAFEHIFYSFRPAQQIIPYLTPHEVRRLLGANHNNEHHRATSP